MFEQSDLVRFASMTGKKGIFTHLFEHFVLHIPDKKETHTVFFSDLDEIIQLFYLYSSVAQSSISYNPKIHLIRSKWEWVISLEIKEESKSNVTNVVIWSMAIIRARTHCTVDDFFDGRYYTKKVNLLYVFLQRKTAVTAIEYYTRYRSVAPSISVGRFRIFGGQGLEYWGGGKFPPGTWHRNDVDAT